MDQLTIIDKNIPIILTGLMVQDYKQPVTENIKIMKSLSDTMNLLTSL
jgi:hypothetical protein